MEILNLSQGMSVMTKTMKKDGNVSVNPFVLTLKNTEPSLKIH